MYGLSPLIHILHTTGPRARPVLFLKWGRRPSGASDSEKGQMFLAQVGTLLVHDQRPGSGQSVLSSQSVDEPGKQWEVLTQ